MANRTPQQSAGLSRVAKRLGDGPESFGRVIAHRAPTALSFNDLVRSYRNSWNSGHIMFTQIPPKFQAAVAKEV